MGRPIGTAPRPGSTPSTRCTAHQTVASVGPYRFQRDAEPSRRRCASSGASASPPQRIFILAPVAHTRLTGDLPGFQDDKMKQRMDPSLVSPLVVYLASDLSKDMTNKTFFVGGGRIAEMKVVTAKGVTKAEGGGLWTPQEVAARMPEILLPE